jgi:hypothetical protein
LRRRSSFWMAAEKAALRFAPCPNGLHRRWRHLLAHRQQERFADRRMRRHHCSYDERAAGFGHIGHAAANNHSPARPGHVRRYRRASLGWLGAYMCLGAVADGAHCGTHWAADSSPWRAEERTLDHWICVAELYPRGRWENAANGQLARTRGLDRSDFLEAVSTVWSELDPEEYPFARGLAAEMRAHDDPKDFLAGIDLILRGIDSPRRI